jgi:hypothetical protein
VYNAIADDQVVISPNTRLVLEKGEYEIRLIDRNGNLTGISEMRVPNL